MLKFVVGLYPLVSCTAPAEQFPVVVVVSVNVITPLPQFLKPGAFAAVTLSASQVLPVIVT